MSAMEALRQKRMMSPTPAPAPEESNEQPNGRAIALMPEEMKGLEPGKEVTVTITGRVNPKGELEVTAVAPTMGPEQSMQPPLRNNAVMSPSA